MVLYYLLNTQGCLVSQAEVRIYVEGGRFYSLFLVINNEVLLLETPIIFYLIEFMLQ